jgi:heptosyltransferase-1
VKVLIVRLGSMGDLVHALPVAAAIRDAWPTARLDWLVDARYVDILRYVPVLDRRIVVSTAGRRLEQTMLEAGDANYAGKRRIPAALRDLRRERYDVALDLQGLIKSAAFSRLAGARRTIGFTRRFLREPAASIFYGETVDPTGAVHVVDKNLAVLLPLGIAASARRFPLEAPSSTARDTVRVQLNRQGVTRFALLNPGAAWPNKRWPPDRFAAVASWLRRAHGMTSVVLWGPAEGGLARIVVDEADGSAVLAPPTNVGDLLAIAKEASLVVSGDTGPLHLAAACGVPAVALFGPTDPGRNGPWALDDISLSRFDHCVCHYQRRCRRRVACIEEITVEDVRGAIDRRLAIANHA